MKIQLSEDQERRLALHAAARNLTPEQALQELLDDPPPRKRAWSPQELDYLRDPRNSPRSIAAYTGRSITAVSNRRHLLATKENITALLRPGKDTPAS